jgi:ABC-type uncharacterized transport system substrate-binding protein
MAHRVAGLMAASFAALGFMSGAAAAHPHVWVDAKAEIVFENGRVAGVRHAWTFDDMYSAFLVQGIGKIPSSPTEEELRPIAKANIENLPEFEFFTFMKAAGGKVEFGAARDYSMSLDKEKLATLKFYLPLKTPVALDPTFKFQVYDPNYFVAFTLEKVSSIRLTRAPAGCTPRMIAPQTLSDADIKILEDSQASGQAPGVEFGLKMAGHLVIECR